MNAPNPETDPRAAVDAYIDAVERALLDAEAPRADRLQILQDLEAQIADMLARQPQPLTTEAVRAVIDSLDPPSHFAAPYNAAPAPEPQRPADAPPAPTVRDTYRRWLLTAAIACAATILFGLILILTSLQHTAGTPGPFVFFFLLFTASAILTPIALRKCARRLRDDPAVDHGRDLIVKALVAYGVAVPVTLLLLLSVATEGYFLYPIAVAALIYAAYIAARRLHRYALDLIAPRPESPSHEGEHPSDTPPDNHTALATIPAT